MSNLSAIFKDPRQMLGKRLVRMLLIWIPLGIGLLFGGIFNWRRVPTEIPIAVWNRDDQSLSRAFLHHVDAMQAIRIGHQVTSAEEGKALFCAGEVLGVLEIPADFSRNLRVGKAVKVVFYQDFTYLLPGRTLGKAISRMELWQQEKGLKDFFQKNGLSGGALEFLQNPLKVEYHKLFNPSLDYSRYLLPGLIGGLLFQVLFLLGAKLFVWWHQGGGRQPSDLWRRIGWAVFLSYIPFFICFGLLFPLFHLGVGNPGLLALMHGPFSLATLLLGMLIAAMFRKEVMVVELIVGLGAVAFTLSGFTWPREMFPWILKHLVALYPLTWLLEEGSKIWYKTGYPVNWLAFFWQIILFGGVLTGLVYKRRNEGVLAD